MDSARRSHPAPAHRSARRIRRRIGITVRGASALAVLAACSSLSENNDGIAVLEIRLPVTTFLEFGESVTLTAVARDADGEIVQVPLVWRTPDTNVTLTPAGLLTARDSTGTARVQVAVDGEDPLATNLNNFVFGLTRRADSLRLVGPDSIEVARDTETSAALDVRLVQVPAGTPVPGRPLVFRIVDPAPSSNPAVVLSRGGTVSDSVMSSASGGTPTAIGVRSATGRVPPDRVVVEATAYRASGEPIPGSPQRFVIRFLHQ